MAIFLYRRPVSASATELANLIGATRYRAINLPIERKVRPGDTIVCWGESVVPIDGVKILNGAPIQNKLADALKLREKGVPTIEVSRTAPIPVPAGPPPPDPAYAIWQRASELAEDFVNADATNPVTRNAVYQTAVQELLGELEAFRQAIAIPPPGPIMAIVAEWLKREANHTGGSDLLNPPANADFFVKKEALTREFRVHSFKGRSIRSGVKRAAEGVEAHPWIRSYDAGWRIIYDGVTSEQRHRTIAHSAVEALGLDFGAVDIGERADGSLIVLEVNRAPGLEGGTVGKYADAIQRFMQQ